MVHRLASFPQAGHFVLPDSIGVHRDWSNGMASDLAPAEGARSSCGSDLIKIMLTQSFRQKSQILTLFRCAP